MLRVLMPNRSGCGKGRETGNLAVNAANIVKANDTPSLVTINQISPLYLTFSLPERELVAIKSRMDGKLPVEASVPNCGLATETGIVTILDNGVAAS